MPPHARWFSVLALVACASPATDPSGSSPWYAWHVDDGWTVGTASFVPDVDGDGQADVVVWIERSDALRSEWRALVMTGPLAEERVLSDQASVQIDGLGALDVTFADASGDGTTDLIVSTADSGARYVQGPLPSVVDWRGASELPARPWERVADINADGVADLWGQDPATGAYEFTWGPLERWEGVPDLTLTAPLCMHGAKAAPHFFARVHPDVDADGVPELWLTGGTYDYSYHVCDPVLIPLPERGDLFSMDLPAHADWPYWQPIPDQTGDGVDDVLVLSGQNQVLGGPVEFLDGDIVGTGPSFSAAYGGSFGLQYTRVDIDADGIGDLLAQGRRRVSLSPGGEGAELQLGTGLRLNAETNQRGVVVQGGRALVLAAGRGGVYIGDLGPATWAGQDPR